MTRRFFAGFGTALILVASVGAQTQVGPPIQTGGTMVLGELRPIQTGPNKITYPGHVTITGQTTIEPARLVSETVTAHGSEAFEAQAKTLEVKYGGFGVSVTMTSGSYTATDENGKKSHATFSGTLRVDFAANGGLAEVRVDGALIR